MSDAKQEIDTGSMKTGAATGVGGYRWVICALLFFCTTINYVDRNALGVLKETLQEQLHWTQIDYGWITFAFVGAYAAFPSIIGILIDRVGVKRSLALALIVWSLAAAAHALVASVIGFVVVRFVLGIAEAANFPASIKAVALWFPQKERALATGIFNSGTSVGVVVGSLACGWIAAKYGWQWAFLVIGAIGFFWLIFWQKHFDLPEKHPKVGAAELQYIRAGQSQSVQTTQLPWWTLVRYRQIWPFLLGKFLTDPVWWFYLFWLPSFFKDRNLSLTETTGLMAIIYTGSSVGSVFGGWLSGALMKRGWHVGKARLTTMLAAAIFMPGSIVAYYTSSIAVCVTFITLAAACHQAWSANIFTSATDLFPSRVSGSVVGLGATAGGIGGMFMTLLVALAKQWTGNHQFVFICVGVMHLTSLAIFWFWFHGRFDQVDADARIDVGSRHLGLQTAGIVVGIAGIALSCGIFRNWDVCVAATNTSGAAQALTAALGVVFIGMALFYASLPRRAAAGS